MWAGKITLKAKQKGHHKHKEKYGDRNQQNNDGNRIIKNKNENNNKYFFYEMLKVIKKQNRGCQNWRDDIRLVKENFQSIFYAFDFKY